jgi:hypothetical protein
MIQNVAAARLWGKPDRIFSVRFGNIARCHAGIFRLSAADRCWYVAWSAIAFATTIQAAAVTFAKFQNLAALSVFGNCSNAASSGGNVTGTAAQVLRVNDVGTACGLGAIVLSQSAAVTGTLSPSNLRLALTLRSAACAAMARRSPERHTWGFRPRRLRSHSPNLGKVGRSSRLWLSPRDLGFVVFCLRLRRAPIGPFAIFSFSHEHFKRPGVFAGIKPFAAQRHMSFPVALTEALN